MLPNLAVEIAALPRLRVSELRVKYGEVFGDSTPSHNKVWLVKRIAWRLQAQAEGDLSERARKRAAELVADADLRLSPPRANQADSDAAEPAPTLRSAEPVSRDRCNTSRQFRRKYPGFQGFLERKRFAGISRRLPCDPERSEAQWAGRCTCHRAVSTTENLPCFRILQPR